MVLRIVSILERNFRTVAQSLDQIDRVIAPDEVAFPSIQITQPCFIKLEIFVLGLRSLNLNFGEFIELKVVLRLTFKSKVFKFCCLAYRGLPIINGY